MLESKPRHALTAAVMSSVLPGFGQFYNGELNKAIWLFLCFALLSIPGIVFLSLHLPGGLMIPALVLSLLTTLAIWLYGIVDAWRQARLRQDYIPESWQISGVYLLILILCHGVALPFLTGYVRSHQVEAYRIPSASMQPTILRGDYIFADKRYNCPGCKGAIRRGDIAVFVYPNNHTKLYIKRIIALPGDRVEITGSRVSVNGVPLSSGAPDVEGEGGRKWRVTLQSSDIKALNIDVVVPPGRVYVLGDNRGDSVDSRKFGMVPMQDVVGKARQIWFSLGPNGVRWSRIGMVLD